ncbi:winged helix-turn-helix domain-containing protein [Streptomyces sp. NPDC053048]|uniref:winged helix-turn-helix domain-containing protein n=1 Tax=Streptomyces sp. NPDC053048 TaxID=3365694 RepID=UPI0037D7D349
MEYGPDAKIDRDAPEAPYEQLLGILRTRLQRGDWKPNRRMSSENELAEEYGLSRPTIRRALAALAEEGWLYKVPKRGTFARDRSLPMPPSDV